MNWQWLKIKIEFIDIISQRPAASSAFAFVLFSLYAIIQYSNRKKNNNKTYNNNISCNKRQCHQQLTTVNHQQPLLMPPRPPPSPPPQPPMPPISWLVAFALIWSPPVSMPRLYCFCLSPSLSLSRSFSLSLAHSFTFFCPLSTLPLLWLQFSLLWFPYEILLDFAVCVCVSVCNLYVFVALYRCYNLASDFCRKYLLNIDENKIRHEHHQLNTRIYRVPLNRVYDMTTNQQPDLIDPTHMSLSCC